MHGGDDFVSRIIGPEHHGLSACSQLLGVIANSRWWVEVIPRAGKMKDSCVGRFVNLTRVPIARNSTADAHDSAQPAAMSKGEPIINGARLRESEQENPDWIRHAFVDQFRHKIEKGLMMNRNRFFRPKICHPPEAKP